MRKLRRMRHEVNLSGSLRHIRQPCFWLIAKLKFPAFCCKRRIIYLATFCGLFIKCFQLCLPSSGNVLSAGPVIIDEDAYVATVGGQQLDLTYTEFELLKYLVAHPGRVLTREMLRSQVWGEGAAVDLRTVDQNIRRLRRELGEADAGELIRTVRHQQPSAARRDHGAAQTLRVTVPAAGGAVVPPVGIVEIRSFGRGGGAGGRGRGLFRHDGFPLHGPRRDMESCDR